MQKTKTNKLRFYVKWLLWIVLAQFILANISASVYAYKFTHFKNPPAPSHSSQNIFNKTWKLFVGPTFYKDTIEPQPSFSYQNISLQTSDHIPIDAWYSATDSAKTCVILVHGYSLNKSVMNNEAAMFRHWGFSVLLIDLRGHGKSGGSSTTFGVKETDELQKAFQFVKHQGYSNIIVYGMSLGAVVAMKATAENKINPSAVIADMPFGKLRNHFRKRAELLGFPSEPFATLVTAWIGIENNFNGLSYDITLYAPEINCPVLVQWGKKDQYIMQNEIENIYHHLASKNKKLVMYPDAGHELFLRNDPAVWQKEVQTFLSTVSFK